MVLASLHSSSWNNALLSRKWKKASTNLSLRSTRGPSATFLTTRWCSLLSKNCFRQTLRLANSWHLQIWLSAPISFKINQKWIAWIPSSDKIKLLSTALSYSSKTAATTILYSPVRCPRLEFSAKFTIVKKYSCTCSMLSKVMTKLLVFTRCTFLDIPLKISLTWWRTIIYLNFLG